MVYEFGLFANLVKNNKKLPDRLKHYTQAGHGGQNRNDGTSGLQGPRPGS